MTKVTASYDAGRVKEWYERTHPEYKVVGLFKTRKAAFKALDQAAGRKVDLSYGYYVVIEPAA